MKVWQVICSLTGTPSNYCPNEAMCHNGRVIVLNDKKADVSQLSFSKEDSKKLLCQTGLAVILGRRPSLL